jgi:hypothetical protein
MPMNARTGTDVYYNPGYGVVAPNTPLGMPLSPPSIGAYQSPAPQAAAPTAPRAPVNPHQPGGIADTTTHPPGGSAVSVNPNNPLGPTPAALPPNPNPVMQPPGAPTGTQPSTGQLTGNQQLYDWANPTQALVNTMRNRGVDVNPLSPLFQTLMRAAPGLANAFLLQGAAGNDQSADQYANFSGFLGNALSQGNVPTVLRNAEGSLGSMIPQARAYLQANQGGSPNPLQGNTLLGALASVLGANNGAGAMDVLSNLHTPFLNRNTASAYQNLLAGPTGLGSQANTALGNYFAGGGDQMRDFWYYLLGR